MQNFSAPQHNVAFGGFVLGKQRVKDFILTIYTTAKKKRPNQLGYLVGIWL